MFFRPSESRARHLMSLLPSRAKYGPVFRVNLATTRLTYITSAPAISSVYKLSKPLQFSEIRKEMSLSVFGYRREFMTLGNDFFSIHHKLIANENMVEPSRVLVRRIEREMLGLVSQGVEGQPTRIGLKELSIKGLYSQCTISPRNCGAALMMNRATGRWLR